MNVNRLIHYAEIYNPTDTVSNKGEQVIVYNAYDPPKYIYCRIEPLSGRELYWAKQLRADATHKITARYNALLTRRTRIVWNGKTFECGPPLNEEEMQIQVVFTAIEVC